MKKLINILIITLVLFPVGYYAWAQYGTFVGAWSDAHGSELAPAKFFVFFFNDGTFNSVCQDKNFHGDGTELRIYQEKGTYISSSDSIFITIKESNVPNFEERTGLTFGIKYIYNPEQNHTILFTNAPILTFGWAKEDTVKFVGTVTSVNNSKWSDIKFKFLKP